MQNLLGILPQVQQRQLALIRPTATNCRFVLNCRRIASPGVGPLRRGRVARHRTLATSCTEVAIQTASAIGDDRLQREAKAMSCPMPSRTDPPNSARASSLTGLKSGQACKL